MNPSVSVIIPNFNGKKLLEENLPSVFEALNFSSHDYEVIIPDDASADDSISFLKEKYPGIIVLSAKKNGGFTVNANRGISRAEKKYTLILNNDVKLKKDYFSNQFRHFEKSGTFGVMGSIYSVDEKLIDAAKYPKWNGFQINSTLNFSLLNAPRDFQIPTYFLSGANALIDTEKLKMLSGFNEIYSPFYMEDVDLSVRAWRMGWKCYYEPGAICYHSVSDTINKHNPSQKVKIISKRNKFIFHEIHLGKRKKLFWKMKLFFLLPFRWLKLDFNFYQSFWEYFNLMGNAKLSATEFMKQQPAKSIEEVVREIQDSVDGMEKRMF